MEKERIKSLRNTKRVFLIFNVFFACLLLFITHICYRLNFSALSIAILDIVIIVIILIIDYEAFILGIKYIANYELTQKVLSPDSLKEVIPVNPPNEVDLQKMCGTYNSMFGNIHNNLVYSASKGKLFAALSKNMEMVQIYREDENTLCMHLIGLIRPDEFPYFYDLKMYQNED